MSLQQYVSASCLTADNKSQYTVNFWSDHDMEVLIFLSVLQPWAFQAREFLRKKLIGKEVCFTVEIKTALGREYGMVYLGKGESTVSHKIIN